MSLTNEDFNLQSVTLYGEEESIDFPTLLLPNTTRITIHYILKEGTDQNICYIKVESGSDGHKVYKYYPITADEAGLSSNTLTITVPVLNTDNNKIKFICHESVESDDNVSYVEIPDATTIEYNGYVRPFNVSLKNSVINRYSDDYSVRSYKGKNIKVEALLLDFSAGDLSMLQNDSKMIISVIQHSPNEEEKPDAVEVEFNEINQFFSGNGYTDDDNDNYLFGELNDADFFKNTDFSYSFQCKFTYMTLAPGEDSWTHVAAEFITAPFELTKSHSTLQLVGETSLSSGDKVYGGVAIGTDPTITTIGAPALECGYPAYFNSNVFFESIEFGFHANESVELAGIVLPGIISNSSKTIVFTINLGQPIFANAATLTGQVTLRSINGYVANYTASSPHVFNNQELQIVNKKCGILQLKIGQSTSFKRDSDTSTAISNNTPIMLSVPGGLDGGKNFTINFT